MGRYFHLLFRNILMMVRPNHVNPIDLDMISLDVSIHLSSKHGDSPQANKLTMAHTAFDVANSLHGASLKTIIASSYAEEEGSSGSTIISFLVGIFDPSALLDVSLITFREMICSGTRDMSSSCKVFISTISSSSSEVCSISTTSTDGRSLACQSKSILAKSYETKKMNY